MPLPVQQASVKLFVQDHSSVDLDDFIPVFHAWIREKRISDQLLIDVADYRHVPRGPGVILIANEAHYGMDSTGGEFGLRYLRRRDAHGDARAALRDALRRAVQAATFLEAEDGLGGKLRFRTDNLQMRIVSRLHTPNTEATRQAIEPVWSGLLQELGFAEPALSPEADARSPFGLRLESCASAPDLAALQAAL